MKKIGFTYIFENVCDEKYGKICNSDYYKWCNNCVETFEPRLKRLRDE